MLVQEGFHGVVLCEKVVSVPWKRDTTIAGQHLFVTLGRAFEAKGSYRIGGGQGPGKTDAKPGGRTTKSSGGIDGLAAGLQAPVTEGFAFWNPPSPRPLRRPRGR